MSFTAFPLDKLGLSPAHIQLCTKANYINAQDVLLPSVPDLSRRLKIRLTEAQDLVRAVSAAIAPRTSIVSTLVHTEAGSGADGGALGKRKRWNGGLEVPRDADVWIRTGDEGLDTLLGGGIRIGCVTEIVGESAAGKSHLTLHLAIAAQLPSLTSRPGGAMILTSERELATTRLKHFAEDMRRKHAQNIFLKRDSLIDGVYTRRVENVEELEAVLSYGVPALLEQGRSGKEGEGSRLMGFAIPKPAQPEALDGDEEGDGVDPKRRPITSRESASATPARPAHTPSLLTPLPRANRRPTPRTSTSALPPLAAPRSRAPTRAGPIRLIILDSLTALLRGAETSFTSTSAGFTARSRHLCSIGDKLKALAVEYELAIVVINQVSDVFDRKSYSKPAVSNDDPPSLHPLATQHPSSSGSLNLTHDQAWYAAGPDPPMLYATQSRWFSGQGTNGKKEATLGIVWANMVNTRVMLTRTGRRRLVNLNENDGGGVAGEDPGVERREVGRAAGSTDLGQEEDGGERMLIRKAHLVFSPFAPPGSVDFVIGENGVQALGKSYKLDESGATVLARARKRGLVLDGEEEEEVALGAEGDGEDDMFGPMDGLDDVPDEWWAGIVDGETRVAVAGTGGENQ